MPLSESKPCSAWDPGTRKKGDIRGNPSKRVIVIDCHSPRPRVEAQGERKKGWYHFQCQWPGLSTRKGFVPDNPWKKHTSTWSW